VRIQVPYIPGLNPFDAEFNWEALSESPVMDDVETMQKWAEEADERRAGP